ncbi:MAG TPA: hypothetical protein VMX55_08285 [candidate division Zixibacteria bacterium]|nr:hypothetical protein [candidate division Zixibacteria bacterium]
MNIEGFRNFGKERNYSEEIVEEAVKIIKAFNEFLSETKRDIDSANAEDVHKYAQHLIETKMNKKETYFALIRYCFFSGNENMLIALYELLDGSDVLDNLAKELYEVVGSEKSKQILEGIDFPVLGIKADKKPVVTKKVIDRLVENIDEKTCHKILVSNLHGIPKESYKGQREKFLKTENVDEYLKERHENFIKTLEKNRDEKKLFYTQEVDDEVINHVKNNAQIEGGVRKGNIVYAEKIPYMTKKFLNEKDENMKKYYYCHCSWVREALRTGETKVPSKFCTCSAGYYKNQWDVILDQTVDVEVVETILDGDSRCLFAIHLPEEVVKKTEKL